MSVHLHLTLLSVWLFGFFSHCLLVTGFEQFHPDVRLCCHLLCPGLDFCGHCQTFQCFPRGWASFGRRFSAYLSVHCCRSCPLGGSSPGPVGCMSLSCASLRLVLCAQSSISHSALSRCYFYGVRLATLTSAVCHGRQCKRCGFPSPMPSFHP